MPKKKQPYKLSVLEEHSEITFNFSGLPTIIDYVGNDNEIKVIKWIGYHMVDHVILLNMKMREKVMKELNISRSTMTKAIKLLQENEVIFKDDNLSCTNFRVNPSVIIKK